MNNPKLILFVALGLIAVFFISFWMRALAAGRAVENGPDMPTPTNPLPIARTPSARVDVGAGSLATAAPSADSSAVLASPPSAM